MQRWIWAAAVVLGLGSAVVRGEEAVPAITKPSQDVTLSFSQPARVAEVPVKEGEAVTKGQLVAKQDDRAEVAACELDKFKAEDDTQTEVKQAILEQKKVDLQKKKASGVASTFELSEAKLEVTVAEANVKLAKFDHAQDGRKYFQTKTMLEKMRLESPVTGMVEQCMVKVGEGVDYQTKVMRIVNIDPLWVEAPVKLAEARQIAKGNGARVAFSDGKAREGKVIFVANVADAASDTLLVRVEVGNPSKVPAGERVTVTFEKSKVAAPAASPAVETKAVAGVGAGGAKRE